MAPPIPSQQQMPGSPLRSGIPERSAPSSPMSLPQQRMNQMQQHPGAMQHHQQRHQPPPHVETVEETPMVVPPPIVAGGGMSISDAFEGLSLTSEQQQQPPPPSSTSYLSAPPVESRSLPSYVPEAPEYESATAAAIAPISPQPYSQPKRFFQEKPVVSQPPAPTPSAAAMSIPDASSYDLGDAHFELDKLKSVLQKLQAENISLKAQLGNMTDDEKEVHKELGVVVAEIGKLSSELSVQRQHVLDAKNSLLEASAELKAQHEHKR